MTRSGAPDAVGDAASATPGAWDEDRRARAALGVLGAQGDPRLTALVAKESPAEVWRTLRTTTHDTAWARRARDTDVEAMLAGAAAHHLRFVLPGDGEWPTGLDTLVQAEVGEFGGAPLGLWVRGGSTLRGLTAGSVAVVGSRASTPYGEHATTELCYDLARRQRAIVSGGAFGIDAAAHRAALAAGGATVVVLACGLDHSYPAAHARLFAEVEMAGGLLVSEHPPATHPTRRAFLVRNRLIAAMSEATVIVEAAARSGARNTVAWAHACGRPVLAVPGPITSALSVTPHRLVRDQAAVLAASADDVEAVLAPMGQGPLLDSGGNARRLDAVPPHLMHVREVLPGRGGATVAEVAAASGLPVARCLASLAELEELGLAGADTSGRWRAVRP